MSATASSAEATTLLIMAGRYQMSRGTPGLTLESPAMPGTLLTAFILVSLGGTVLVVLLLRGYGSASDVPSPLRVTTADLGGFTQRGLILSSLFGLYLELLLIRWISSEI